MPLVRMVLGAEADIASSAEVDQLRDDMGAGFKSVLGRRNPRPLYQTFAQSAFGNADNSPLIIPLGGPASGRAWDIRQLITMGQDDHVGVFSFSTAGVAAAGATANVPPGAALLGFSITSATAAAPVSGEVTISPVQRVGGSLRYQYTFQPNGSELAINFPQPIFPTYSSAGGVQGEVQNGLAITMPAVVGGSAYDITVYYQPYVAWYVSDRVLATNILATGQPVPSTIQPSSSESAWLHYGEKLTAVFYGVTPANPVTAACRIADWPENAVEAYRV